MALSTAKTKLLPPKITIYSEGGLGKTTFGAQSKDPIFIPTENGLVSYPDVAQYPQPETFEEFTNYLVELSTQDHDRKTLVIDSLGRLEDLIFKKVCAESGVKSIEEASGGFGKGYITAIDIWREEVLKPLDYLNREKDMAIILIAHAQVKRYDNPQTQSYDRYTIRLYEGKNANNSAVAAIFEWSDIVLFANYYVGVTKDALPGSTKKNPKEHTRGIGSGERVLYTEERPAFKAKNRYDLPEQITFDKEGTHWEVLASHIPYYKQ